MITWALFNTSKQTEHAVLLQYLNNNTRYC